MTKATGRTKPTAGTTATQDEPGTGSAVLQINGLTKSFGAVRAVHDLDLEVASGEMVAFLGPNGAGKSTTNEMILGMTQPDAGTVQVLGQSPEVAVRGGGVGAMLQAGALLNDAKAGELLRLMHGLHAHPLPLGEVIERADVADFLGTKTDKLSGGQAQRLRFAMAIMPDPELLILDEPTVGMDVEIRRTFWRSMRDFTADGHRTVLFATHYLDEADAQADRIVVLANGTIIADGTGAQIKSRVAGRSVGLAADGVDLASLAVLRGVTSTERVGARILLHSTNSDATLRALLEQQPDAHDIEVTSARLEDAFLALVQDSENDA